MIRFVLQGETASKKNGKQVFVKNGRPIVTTSTRYKAWYSLAKKQLLSQMVLVKNELPVEGEIKLEINFFHGDNRRRDSDNGLSSILDLLVDCGIITDDKWQIVRKIKVTNEKEKDSFCVVSVDKIK